MTVKSGSAWAGAFVTLDATGALEAGTPSGVLYVDGVADAATVTITGSNPYKWSVTLPSLTAGQRVDMYITATISTIATAGFVASEQADTALVSEVKAETASILEDTGTTIPGTLAGLATSANLQTVDDNVDAVKAKTDNIPESPAAVGSAMTLTAAYDKAKDDVLTPLAVVDSIVDGLKTTLDNIHDTDLPAVKTETAAIKAKTDKLPADPADDSDIDAQLAAIKAETALIVEDTGTTIPATLADLALEATLTAIKGDGWNDETLVALMTAIEAISAGSGAIAQEVWEYTTRVLTGSSLTAADLWSYTPRTLTNAGTTITNPADGDPLYIYNNQTVIIELTNLGSVAALTAAEDKVWFTIKENLDDPDTSAILHIITTAPGDLVTDESTLTWVNGTAPISATGGVLAFTDVAAGDVTITLDAAEAANMPIYAVTPVYWDIKSLDYSSGVVTILQTGTAYIYNSSTKTIA